MARPKSKRHADEPQGWYAPVPFDESCRHERAQQEQTIGPPRNIDLIRVAALDDRLRDENRRGLPRQPSADRGHDRFHQRVARRDRGPAVATAAAEAHPSQDRHVVVPANRSPASRTARAWTAQIHPSRQSVHDHVHEATETAAECRRDGHEKPTARGGDGQFGVENVSQRNVPQYTIQITPCSGPPGAQRVDTPRHRGIFDQRRRVVRLQSRVDHERAATTPMFVRDEGTDAVHVRRRIAACEGHPQEVGQCVCGEVRVIDHNHERKSVDGICRSKCSQNRAIAV